MASEGDTALIAQRMRQTFQVTGDVWFERAAAALAALAQDNERQGSLLRQADDQWMKSVEAVQTANARAEAAEARMREQDLSIRILSDDIKRRDALCEAEYKKLVEERDAKEAETIERCAKVAEEAFSATEKTTLLKGRIAAAIRAMRHSGREAG